MKSNKAKEFICKNAPVPCDYTVWTINECKDYAKKAVEETEKDLEDKAILAYCKCCDIGKVVSCDKGSKDCPFLREFVKLLNQSDEWI